jgi:hypothetical protein
MKATSTSNCSQISLPKFVVGPLMQEATRRRSSEGYEATLSPEYRSFLAWLGDASIGRGNFVPEGQRSADWPCGPMLNAKTAASQFRGAKRPLIPRDTSKGRATPASKCDYACKTDNRKSAKYWKSPRTQLGWFAFIHRWQLLCV